MKDVGIKQLWCSVKHEGTTPEAAEGKLSEGSDQQLPRRRWDDANFWRLMSMSGQMRRSGWQTHSMFEEGFLQTDLDVVGYDPTYFEPERIKAAKRAECQSEMS